MRLWQLASLPNIFNRVFTFSQLQANAIANSSTTTCSQIRPRTVLNERSSKEAVNIVHGFHNTL